MSQDKIPDAQPESSAVRATPEVRPALAWRSLRGMSYEEQLAQVAPPPLMASASAGQPIQMALEDAGTRGQYAAGARKAAQDAPGMGAEYSRDSLLMDTQSAVNAALAAGKVHSVDLLEMPQVEGSAKFMPGPWAILVREAAVTDALAAGNPKAAQAALFRDVYHEARHAEQCHLMARYQLQIRQTTNIPADAGSISGALGGMKIDAVNTAIAAGPLPTGGGEWAQAEQWFNSMFTPAGLEVRRQIKDRLKRHKEAVEAARKANDDKAAQQAIADYNQAWNDYRTVLPEEADAYAAGDAAHRDYLALP